jgi:hypothetical protein
LDQYFRFSEFLSSSAWKPGCRTSRKAITASLMSPPRAARCGGNLATHAGAIRWDHQMTYFRDHNQDQHAKRDHRELRSYDEKGGIEL